MTNQSAVPLKSISRITSLIEKEGLCEFTGETVQEHIEVWREIDGQVESAQWAMSAIAASLTTKYGEGDVKKFAEAVNRTPGYIYKMARTYRFYSDRQKCPQGHFSDLTFSHHVRALTHPEPVEALQVAQDQGLSAIGLEEWVTQTAKEGIDKPKPVKPKRENDYRVWLERMDISLLKEVSICPNKEFARRVIGREWRETIAWELREINRSENRELILAAIEDGAHTEDDLRKVTRLTNSEVSGCVGALVAEGMYEWVREGGETEMARGSRRSILHRVGTPVFTR